MSIQQPPQRPEKEFRAGTITAAIWRHENERDGQTVIARTIRLQKRYKDRDTQTWQDSEFLFPEDLPKVELVVRAAYEYIMLKQRDPNAQHDVDPAAEADNASDSVSVPA